MSCIYTEILASQLKIAIFASQRYLRKAGSTSDLHHSLYLTPFMRKPHIRGTFWDPFDVFYQNINLFLTDIIYTLRYCLSV